MKSIAGLTDWHLVSVWNLLKYWTARFTGLGCRLAWILVEFVEGSRHLHRNTCKYILKRPCIPPPIVKVHKPIMKQECIPVGCVPAECWPYSGDPLQRIGRPPPPRKIGDPPKNWRPPEKLETPLVDRHACENITLGTNTSFRPVMMVEVTFELQLPVYFTFTYLLACDIIFKYSYTQIPF